MRAVRRQRRKLPQRDAVDRGWVAAPRATRAPASGPAPFGGGLPNRTVGALLAGPGAAGPTLTVQRKPAGLVNGFKFLGKTVGGGINKTLKARLENVEKALKKQYEAIVPSAAPEGADPADLEVAKLREAELGTFERWAGVTSINGWRKAGTWPPPPGQKTFSRHLSGSAVDVNYRTQPYIATRTTTDDKTVYGGESTKLNMQAERKAATEVYDRAMRFARGKDADASARKKEDDGTKESTRDAYERFKQISDALQYYFAFAIRRDHAEVKRKPVADIEGIGAKELLQAIPEDERLPQDEAVALLTLRNVLQWMMLPIFGPAFTTEVFWDLSRHKAREQHIRILRDYEHVRVPMQYGKVSKEPGHTRNPARGFLHLRVELVEAMADVGKLRWGAVDLGERESGDVHHFDLGNHGGVTPDGAP